jgi:hypothetical protein
MMSAERTAIREFNSTLRKIEMTTHELAKILLESPNVRVAFGRYLSPYQCSLVDMRVSAADKLLFNADKKQSGEKREKLFWISEPFI